MRYIFKQLNTAEVGKTNNVKKENIYSLASQACRQIKYHHRFIYCQLADLSYEGMGLKWNPLGGDLEGGFPPILSLPYQASSFEFPHE